MSDRDLRRLEQEWLRSGSDADELAYLQARLRSGRLDEQALAVAAYLGDRVAGTFFEEELLLALKPSKTGVQRWFGELPGDGRTCVRASLAALDHLMAEGRARVTDSGRACQEAIRAWLSATPPAEAELAQVWASLGVFEEDLTKWWPSVAHRYDPDQPLWHFTAEASQRVAGSLVVCCLGRYLVGREGGPPWYELGDCLNALVGREVKTLRALVTESLLPWVLLRDPEGGATPPEPRGEAILGADRMSPEVAAVVLAASDGDASAPSVATAREIVEAYFRALGYRESRGGLVNADVTRRVKIGRRSVKILEGKPGAWSKLSGTEGRQILLTDTAVHLLETARRRRASAENER